MIPRLRFGALWLREEVDMRYMMLVIAVISMGTLIVNCVLGNVVTLFEDNEPLAGRLTGGDAVVSIERFDVYHGSRAIKVAAPIIGNTGQANSRCILDWEYKVVKRPVGSNEVRWVMFAWKKPDSDGIMVQFADDCSWGANVLRYFAGKNLSGWKAIRVSNHVPRGWQIVIRDLYSDFGNFTLTGISLTPFNGVGLFDSIYLAKSKEDLLSVFEPTLGTEVFVDTPSRVSDGATFTASIEVRNVYDLAGFEMEVSFNPDVIKVNRVEEGTFLSSGGVTYWLNPDDDNSRGKITEIACVRTDGRSGDGTLFTIVFKARDEGSSNIVLENVRLADSEVRIIPTKVTDASVEVATVPRWDVNADGRVDFLDLVIVAQHFGEYINQPGEENPDVTGDGKVDVTDLITVGRHYGDVYGDAAPSKLAYSVPLRFVPSLEKALDLVRSSPHPDKTTIKLLMGLIKNAKPIKDSTWGARKFELR